MAREQILIVDDEMDVLDLCKRILISQGYKVDSARNGYEAIDIARNNKFDLLLTDIKMPGMSGLEIAQQLKDFDPSIICVTMTGFSTMDMAINALKLGIDEFILKPFTPKELSAAIAKALDKERLRQENSRLRSLIPLFELNKTLMSTVDEDSLLSRVLQIVQNETNASFAGIHLIQDGKITQSFHSYPTESQVEASEKLSCGLLENDDLTVQALYKTHPDHHTMLSDLHAESVLVAPIKSQNSTLGVLILSQQENHFAPGDSELLSVLCGQAGVALENARLFTEIQEAYQQLKMLDHMKSEFINIAAHELRTPLAILMGYATVLEEDSPDGQREYVANITRNAMRLRSLIDDMLYLQYLESGVVKLSHEKINLQEFAQGLTKEMALMVKEKDLEVQVDIPVDFPEMIVDRKKLDLILVNLLHNAVKFTPANGHISLTAQANGNRTTISVKNTGKPIPADSIERVFDRFYQAENTLTREHGGAGLGLAIVRGMVDVCGGKIWVESSAKTGTTFNVDLPLDNSNLEARKLQF